MKTSVNRRSRKPESGLHPASRLETVGRVDEAPDPQTLERIAVGLLARREHSRAELLHKLTGRGFAAADIESLLDRLAVLRLQCDARFTTSYVRMRSGRGYGPQRIRAELRERGIDADCIEKELAASAVAAEAPRIEDVWRRKFGDRQPKDYRERAKQMRFLQQRGFAVGDIRDLFGRLEALSD